LYTASQRPKSFGRSRQGSPVRARYSTVSINRRSLSPGGRPARDFKVVRRGAISAHALSVSSKRTTTQFILREDLGSRCVVANADLLKEPCNGLELSGHLAVYTEGHRHSESARHAY